MKAETKKRRKAILQQIDQLEYQQCETCKGYTRRHLSVKCQCAVAIKIRELGQELLDLSGRGPKAEIDAIVEEIKANGMTKETYLQLKEHNITDKELIRLIGWYMGKLYNFKYDEGISKRKGPQHVRLTEKQKQTALANNIPLSLVRSRIRLHAWSVTRAITEPKNAYKQEFQKWLAVAESNGISKSAFENRLRRDETMEEAAKRPLGKHRKKVAQ